MVGIRAAEHREFANQLIQEWNGYAQMTRGVIPPDALTADAAIGVKYYYVPDLRVVDLHGLTDPTVAHHPFAGSNDQRVIAHDRRPSPGYVEERGINLRIYPPSSSELEALRYGTYAILVGMNLWMPFDSDDPEWVSTRLAERSVLWRRNMVPAEVSQSRPMRPDHDRGLPQNRW